MMDSRKQWGKPPWLAQVLLQWVTPARDRRFVLGDLEEEFEGMLDAGKTLRAARRWYWRQLFGSVLPGIGRARPTLSPIHRRPGPGLIDPLARDFRLSVRALFRRPFFAGVAAGTLALGIGANSALFSLVHGVLLRPLSFPDSDRIVVLNESNPSKGWPFFSLAPENFASWRDRSHSFSQMALYRRSPVTDASSEEPQYRQAWYVGGGFLTILGGEFVRGRGFSEDEFEPGAERVVILTHGLWERAFGSSPDVLGTPLILDDLPCTVVGVLAEGWSPAPIGRADVFLPLRPEEWWVGNRTTHFLQGLARLKPGVSIEQAQADVSAVAAALEVEYPASNEGWKARVTLLQDRVTGPVRTQLLALMTCVALVLLIACANVSNMMLARASSRRGEFNIRAALGAGRKNLIFQLLTENLILSLVAGTFGLILAVVSLEFLLRHWSGLLPRSEEIGLNAAVVLFTIGISLATGLVIGVLSSLSVGRARPADSLRGNALEIAGRPRQRVTQASLVVGEVAVTVLLLIVSGLMIQSFKNLLAVHPGFETAGRLTFTARLPDSKYQTRADQLAFAEAVLQRLEGVPGLVSAAVSSALPFGGGQTRWGVMFEGRPTGTAAQDPDAAYYRVSPGYFETMGIPLRGGRIFTRADGGHGSGVAVVSESFARLYFPGEVALGKRIMMAGPDPEWLSIVGVVGDVQQDQLGLPSEPQVYEPFSQRPAGFMTFIAEAEVEPGTLVETLRREVQDADPHQPFVGFQPMDDLLLTQVSLPRFRTALLTCFGGVALFLAVVGLYGVLSFAVSRRTQEIGMRIAMGAPRGSVVGLVLRSGLRMVVVGAILGLAGSAVVTRVFESLFFGVGMRDPRIFATVPLLVITVATGAIMVPASRATRIDPVEALRRE